MQSPDAASLVEFERVRAAYADRAEEYTALFGSVDDAAEEDRALITRWASGVQGRVLDVGCGPGQWTDYLRQLGLDAEGIDPVADFVTGARRRYPDAPFRVGRAEALDIASASVGGILAWFSLIHTHPERLSIALAEFARCLRPDGALLIGFCEGPRLEPFDHAVTTAYFWPMESLARVIEDAGFTVFSTWSRADPGRRPQGAISAIRSDGPRTIELNGRSRV